MIITLLGSSGHMGLPTLEEFLKIDEVDCIKVLLKKGFKRNKLVEKLKKKYPQKIDIYYGDLSNKEDILTVIKDSSYLFNLAGIIPPASEKNPKASYLVNELGVKNIVEALEENKNVKLIDVNSMAIYGHHTPKNPYIRVGDPLFAGVYDFYTTHKIRSEFAILESDIPYFVIIRQTAMAYLDMLTLNVGSGIMFHTPFNNPLEWSTAEDSARLFANIIKEDIKGNLNFDNFWRKIFNLGSSEDDRLTGYQTIEGGFAIFGKKTKNVFEPRYNITRNFHGGYFLDGDELDKLFHYRQDKISDYWKKIGNTHKSMKLAKIIPSKLIKQFGIKSAFKDSFSPDYWYKHNDEPRLIAFFKSKEEYEKLPRSWDEFPLWDDKDAKKLKPFKVMDYGFDINKKDNEITYEDLVNVAKKHGGKLITTSFKQGDVYSKVEWENSDKERFTARPFTILRGGHWLNPIYKEYVWDYDRLAKLDEICACFWYDSHDKDENHCYYFDDDLIARIR